MNSELFTAVPSYTGVFVLPSLAIKQLLYNIKYSSELLRKMNLPEYVLTR